MRLRRPALLLALATLVAAALAQAQPATVEASDLVTAVGVVRWNHGTSNEIGDDVLAWDLGPNNQGVLGRGDLIIVGYDATHGFGTLVGEHDVALLGRGEAFTAEAVYIDVDASGAYSSGDTLYLSPFADRITATKLDLGTFSARLTGPDPGTWVRTADTDLQEQGLDASNDLGQGAGEAALTYVDSDGSGTLDAGEAVYVTPSATANGDALPALAVKVGSVVHTQQGTPTDPTSPPPTSGTTPTAATPAAATPPRPVATPPATVTLGPTPADPEPESDDTPLAAVPWVAAAFVGSAAWRRCSRR